MSNNTFRIYAIFALIIFVGLSVGVPTFIIFLWDRRTNRKHINYYQMLSRKYQTNCVGVFKLYGGLPLPSNSICEVAFCGNLLHIVNEHYRMIIPIEDINNIYIDHIQESYIETKYYGGGLVLSSLGLFNNTIGSACRRSAARKHLLVINHRAGVILFDKNFANGFDYLSPNEKYQLTGIHKPKFYLADWIVAYFVNQRYQNPIRNHIMR